MGNLGFQELMLIFVIALIVFGPKKLPDLGKAIGKGLAEFRRASNELRNTWEEEVRLEDLKKLEKMADPYEDYNASSTPSSADYSPTPATPSSPPGAADAAPSAPGETAQPTAADLSSSKPTPSESGKA